MDEFDKKRLDLVKALFLTNTPDPAMFSSQVVAHLPVASIKAIINRLWAEYGSFKHLSTDGEMITIHLERAEIPVQLFLDSHGAINGLRIHPEVLTSGSIEEHAGSILSLPGKSSILIKSGSKTVYNYHEAEPLSVGSAFKLCVLAAVMRAVAAERFTWEEVFLFNDQWRSIPSGILQDWPNGVPLTLMSLCCFMMSLSDNSAADALIHIIGRESVESLSQLNRPFLTTREAFILKAHERSWAQGELSMRRLLLAEIAKHPLPSSFELGASLAPAIGWFFTADEICNLLLETKDHPSVTINPGPISKSRWKRIVFKGGQEPRVLNISLLMTDRNDNQDVIIITYNALEEFDPEAVLLRVRAIARLLEDVSDPGSVPDS